jgi:hypothetical protein
MNLQRRPKSWAMLPTQAVTSGDRGTAGVEKEMIEGNTLGGRYRPLQYLNE